MTTPGTRTTDALTDALLDRFLGELRALAPVAVWAHGSLGGGDYQEGRSDLDLIAVLDGPIGPGTAWQVGKLHARLRTDPLAPLLHCTYLSDATTANPERRHLTWAHSELFRRTVTPVTRRELHTFGRVLYGKSPGELLPVVADRQLTDFVVRDQRDFWRPTVDKAHLWTQDVWVDLGLVTFARATMTLRDGSLLSKREALDLLPGLGAPVKVVEDIARRRYGQEGGRVDAGWRERRGELTRDYLGDAIDHLVTSYT
ncbi:nucleotidyltransferase domain-containing protein [Streptomyces turgidiscabies]|uniref:Nucleotidyltransferase domain protein n=1 Tax=Streptomyces turgidiscabies (strain Car8) TaxID=698760 RepID=L7FHB4_STRT8|nr:MULTISPECIES: nucleotidyltransferase domain-containing protein [Streptomyces]ELP70717.1 nucleotidyltransferase domain protein [Streptomyces turgidiscabies Car8]MDX3498960.1 nucleotidyltransferase domain-containing protein [Streptomyces turgidiscabies]